ncbi:MAG TPA: hypothetical protein PK129_04470 [Cellvibrionaceae bacterium]|nr:hypothetical protein [Cellvibrionaceae bacterium]
MQGAKVFFKFSDILNNLGGAGTQTPIAQRISLKQGRLVICARLIGATQHLLVAATSGDENKPMIIFAKNVAFFGPAGRKIIQALRVAEKERLCRGGFSTLTQAE